MFNLEKHEKNLPDSLKGKIAYQMVGTKNTGKFIFGSGLIRELGKEVKKFEAKKIIVVSDETLNKLGIVGMVKDILEQEDMEVKIFTEIEAEPHAATAKKLSKIVKADSFDVIVGLGGGSVLDMAKISSVTATNTGTVEEYLKGKDIDKDGLPKILIPTTSGTGSEVSPYVVCSIGEQKYYASAPRFFADVALVDPLLTVTMPPKVTANTGLDALSHAIEGMTSKASTPISEAFGVKSMKFILSNLEKAYKDGENLSSRHYMSWASSLGMLAYVNVGGLYAHSFSYIMTSHKEWPHGLGCGYSLPYTLMYNLNFIEDKLAEVFASLRILSKKFNNKEAAIAIITEIQNLAEKVGVSKKLCDFDVGKEEIDTIAEELVNNYYRANNPRELDIENAKKILNNMWSGELKEI